MESKLPKFNAVKLLTYKNKGAIIGYGAYGKVRCCETLKSERVAVKYFPITGTPDEAKEKLSKIMNEAMLLHKLSHQHIIQLLGITQWEEYFGIVLEYLPGGNLDGFLKNEKLKEIPWPLRLRIASQLSDAITYLHQYKENKELIHGDVKPENVLLDKDLVVKLAYFGSVNMIIPSGATKTTTDLPTNKQHTLYYTAPEFLKDSEIPHTVKMDVYSFGMVLYEILTRMRIFENVKRPPDILVQVIIDMKQRPNLNQLEEINKNLSLSDEWIFENLQTHMKKCWSQLPNDRPSMQNVRDSLLILLNEISEESMKEVVKNATEALNMEVKKLDMNEATSLKSAVSSSDDVSSTSTVANSGFVEEISRKFPYTEISQIESLCGNPLQFLRMAYIPSSAYAFASMTRLFSALYDDLDASNPSEITNNLNSWPSLTKLGFSLTKMSEDDVRKFEFDQSVLHHIIKHQQTDTHELCKEKKKLHNIHEKMQAYLTAFHINNQKSDKEFEKFVDEELFSSRWNFVRRFLFGISFDLYRADASQQTKRKLMKEKFLKEISKCIGQHNLVELCCDVRECVDNNIAKELAHRFPTSVVFYLDPLSYSDAQAVSLVMKNVNKTISRLELVDCKLNSQSFRFLAEAIADMKGSINCLDINGNHLASNDVYAICDIMDKLNEELVMHQCFDDLRGGKRNASNEEMEIIENKWRSLQNPNLEVYFGDGYALSYLDSGREKRSASEPEIIKLQPTLDSMIYSNRTVCVDHDINLVNTAQDKVIGKNRGKIQLIDFNHCFVDIPPGALDDDVTFDISLLNETDVEPSNELILTPTMECLPSMEFHKPVTISLPTCYVPESPDVLVVPQIHNGKKWNDMDAIPHGNNIFIKFTTSTFSKFRTRATKPYSRSQSPFKTKILQYVGYQHPNVKNAKKSYCLVWRIHDGIRDPMKLVKNGNPYFMGTLSIRSTTICNLRIESEYPKIYIKPYERKVRIEFNQKGFFCDNTFLILDERYCDEEITIPEVTMLSYFIKVENEVIANDQFPLYSVRTDATETTKSDNATINAEIKYSTFYNSTIAANKVQSSSMDKCSVA